MVEPVIKEKQEEPQCCYLFLTHFFLSVVVVFFIRQMITRQLNKNLSKQLVHSFFFEPVENKMAKIKKVQWPFHDSMPKALFLLQLLSSRVV